MSFFDELKRRNVFRVAIAYLVVSWLLMQVADVVLGNITAPQWVFQALMLFLAVGFPVAIILAWAFEMTPEGLKSEREVDRSRSITGHTGRRIEFLIIGALILAVSTLLIDKFLPQEEALPEQKATAIEQVDSSPTNSIAVLPLVAMSRGVDDEYFADGLTEEILNALAQLPELRVTARTSSFYFKGKNIPVAEIADKLGVTHIVEGSIRRDEDQVRITAQLIRTADGFHVWSDTYDRAGLGGFDVQTEIAEEIASALNIFLDDEQRALMRAVGVRNPQAFIAYQKGVELFEIGHGANANPDSLKKAHEYFEQALQLSPEFFDARALHTDHLTHEVFDHAFRLDSSDEEFNSQYTVLLRDLDALVHLARYPAQGRNAEYMRTLLSGDWRGLSNLTSRMIAVNDCAQPTWPEIIALPFGMSAAAATRFKVLRTCDPLRHIGWGAEIAARVWQNQPEAAIEVALTGMESNSHERLRRELTMAYVAAGKMAEAEVLIDRGLIRESIKQILRIMLSASQGDSDIAEDIIASLPEGIPNTDAIAINAWLGNREESNRIAANFDSHPFGYMVLALAVPNCMCGKPFDLDSTPSFAKRLEAAGLPWPPDSPITWPLKDW